MPTKHKQDTASRMNIIIEWWAPLILAAVCACAGVFALTTSLWPPSNAPSGDSPPRGSLGNPLWYFVAAGLLTKLPRLKGVKWGDKEITLAALSNQIEAASSLASSAMKTAKNTQSFVTNPLPVLNPRLNPGGSLQTAGLSLQPPQPGFSAPAQTPFQEAWAKIRRPERVSNDTWKGIANAWYRHDGEIQDRREFNKRLLKASVSPIEGEPEFFDVEVSLVSTDSSDPVQGEIGFLIDDTFPHSKILIQAKNGKAALTFPAYGAFTVAAVTDKGDVLEYDLSMDLQFPGKFRGR